MGIENGLWNEVSNKLPMDDEACSKFFGEVKQPFSNAHSKHFGRAMEKLVADGTLPNCMVTESGGETFKDGVVAVPKQISDDAKRGVTSGLKGTGAEYGLKQRDEMGVAVPKQISDDAQGGVTSGLKGTGAEYGLKQRDEMGVAVPKQISDDARGGVTSGLKEADAEYGDRSLLR